MGRWYLQYDHTSGYKIVIYFKYPVHGLASARFGLQGRFPNAGYAHNPSVHEVRLRIPSNGGQGGRHVTGFGKLTIKRTRCATSRFPTKFPASEPPKEGVQLEAYGVTAPRPVAGASVRGCGAAGSLRRDWSPARGRGTRYAEVEGPSPRFEFDSRAEHDRRAMNATTSRHELGAALGSRASTRT